MDNGQLTMDNESAAFVNTYRNSADAVGAILALHFPAGRIIDANFGHGVFYKNGTRKRVTGIDIKATGDVIADNRHLPFGDNSFEVGVLDPPYKRGGGNHRYTERYGIAPTTEPRVTRSYFAALPELIRVARDGLIIKCQDAADGHAFHARHIMIASWMAERIGLQPHDIVNVARHSVPNANTQGQRRYFQQTMSYFLIYKWRCKSPFRPVRF